MADIGCGLGASTILLAQEYQNSRFTGSDYHDESIEMARKHAGDQGVADRVSFEVASASTFSGTGYDLAATFDCLHDMGDPLAAARHIRQALKPDGTWLIVEPAAADDVAGNMNPVGRTYYSFSTLLCVPNALSQSGGFALGAQAGEAAIRQVITDAGFTRFRRAAETPFNIVYEVRPSRPAIPSGWMGSQHEPAPSNRGKGDALNAVAGETVSLIALVAVLAWAVARPRGWPEAVAAVPAAVILIAVGALPAWPPRRPGGSARSSGSWPRSSCWRTCARRTDCSAPAATGWRGPAREAPGGSWPRCSESPR